MKHARSYKKKYWLVTLIILGNEAIYSRFLIVKILERMASLGLFVISGLDVTRKDNDKSLLLFRSGAPLAAPFMCLSLNETDKVRLINAPQNVVEVTPYIYFLINLLIISYERRKI